MGQPCKGLWSQACCGDSFLHMATSQLTQPDLIYGLMDFFEKNDVSLSGILEPLNCNSVIAHLLGEWSLD